VTKHYINKYPSSDQAMNVKLCRDCSIYCTCTENAPETVTYLTYTTKDANQDANDPRTNLLKPMTTSGDERTENAPETVTYLTYPAKDANQDAIPLPAALEYIASVVLLLFRAFSVWVTEGQSRCCLSQSPSVP
jgi:hypothetical protein